MKKEHYKVLCFLLLSLLTFGYFIHTAVVSSIRLSNDMLNARVQSLEYQYNSCKILHVNGDL